MFKISKLADYASVTLNRLSQASGEHFSASQVAQSTGIPLPTVSKVLKLLGEAGLVISTRGVNGGYKISRPAKMITLSDIVTAIDGVPALTECAHDDLACKHHISCSLRPNWQAVNQKLLGVLSEMTLADMQQPVRKYE